MKYCKACDFHFPAETEKCPLCRRLLAGVQGPERHLVGDVAERMPQADVVEVSKTVRRGVGEIVELDKLRRVIAWKLRKERRQMAAAKQKSRESKRNFFAGKIAALVEIEKLADSWAEKRSDLSNA